jgi:DNA replication and repair protein RecF
MHLRRIQLTEFRSYHALDLAAPPAGLVAIGQNAAGKSSLLEAVRMLSTLRSPRSQHDRDVINWESGTELGVTPFSRVVGIIDYSEGELTIELGLQHSNEPGGPLRKIVRINQQPRRVLDAVGALKTVLFTPEDLELVSGSPQGRRRFMDLLIGQIDRQYVSELSAYQKVTEQRNSLLKSFARGAVSRHNAIEQLGFWDDQLAEHGSYVSASRRITIGRLCAAFTQRSRLFTASALLTARYAPNLGADFLLAGRADDEPDQVRAAALREFQALIRIRRDDELRRGVTLIGPHRDDLELLIYDRSLASFGSRGQQRLAVVALKLAEADVISMLGERPVLLLDDVLSELDASHRQTLLESVRAFGSQVLLTTADPAQVAGSPIADLEILHVIPGGISASA